MWKQITGIMALSLLCLSLGGCQNTGTEEESLRKESLKKEVSAVQKDGGLFLMTATDLHFLSPELTDHGESFTKMMEKSDGKLTKYADQITDAFLAEVLEAKPDALILSGDLTFNGEKQSHLDLAEKLAVLREHGIPVAVIPGNHDILYPFSYRYEGAEVYQAANIDSEDFATIYADMGYEQALSRDENSLSYVFPLSDQVRLLFLDVNAVEKPGSIPESTVQWAETQLADARSSGAMVIGVTHQNVMVHNDMFIRNYRIGNYNKIVKLFDDYEVPFNLSGHIHIQNIARDTDFSEAATGSLAVWPNLYGTVEISKEGDIAFGTRMVPVADWAKKNKVDVPELLDFENTSREQFDSHNSGNFLEELSYLEVSDSERATMQEFAARVNRLYFAGRLGAQREELREEEGWKLFEEHKDELFMKEYLDSFMHGPSKPDDEILIPYQTEKE